MVADPEWLRGNRHEMRREGDVLRRRWQDWMQGVHPLLQHLANEGVSRIPRVARVDEDGEDGSVLWTYLEGQPRQPSPWSDKGIEELGALIREFHDGAASFEPPDDAIWQRWFIHRIRPATGIGHGELAPWNILHVDGLPTGLIDWEFAGPLDPCVDLAQAAWLNVQLHGDRVAGLNSLPSAEHRAHQLRLFLDAYGLGSRARAGFVRLMVEVAVYACAYEAEISGIMPDRTNVGEQAWAMAWRSEAAAWMLEHEPLLEAAIRTS